MAQKTDAARKRGGSPTALLEYTALGFVAPLMRKKLNHYHLQFFITVVIILRDKRAAEREPTQNHRNNNQIQPEQAHVELGRHVVEAWDLVSAWTSR